MQTGTVGEQIASEFLQGRGYRIVGRKHRSRLVKRDIIADFEEFFVFCEAKILWGINGTHPSLSVTSKNRKVTPTG